MSDFNKEMDTFFAPLVGTEDAIARFQSALSEHTRPLAHTAYAFHQLEVVGESVVRATVLAANGLDPDDNGSGLSLAWKSIWANGERGVGTAVNGAALVSDFFAVYAAVPQTKATVEKNTDRILRHVYRNAFNPARTATYNQLGLRAGRNPANPLNKPAFWMKAMFTSLRDTSVHPRAFRVEIDEAGQLDMQPRHQLVMAKNGRRCPATGARIEVEDESPSALLTFMRTIGNVAIQDIYPHRFAIAAAE